MTAWERDGERKKKTSAAINSKMDMNMLFCPLLYPRFVWIPTVSNGSNPSGMLLSSLSIYLVGYSPEATLPSFCAHLPRRQLALFFFYHHPPHSRHLTGMEMRCKSVCSFQACSHLSEPSTPVTVLRSVSGTLDPRQFGSDGWRGEMLLDKQGGRGGAWG